MSNRTAQPGHCKSDMVSITHDERRVLSWLIESTLAWSELPLYVHEGETLKGFLAKVKMEREAAQ